MTKRNLILGLTFLIAMALVPLSHAEKLVAVQYDLDGGAADTQAIVATGAAADSTTYVLAAQPDTPRPLIITIVDADSSISAGTLTVTGADSAGTALTLVHTYASAGSTTVTSTTNFASVTSVISSALTGEGAGDTIAVGTTSTLPAIYCNLNGSGGTSVPIPGSGWIKTSGSSTTVSSYTTGAGAFAGTEVGDVLFFNLAGTTYERKIVTWTSVNQVVIDSAISTTGAGYTYLRPDCGTTSTEGWTSVAGHDQFMFTIDINQMNGAGGINVTIVCKNQSSLVGASTVYSGAYAAATVDTVTIDDAFDKCRVGLQWGTNDDAVDTAAVKEIINVSLVP